MEKVKRLDYVDVCKWLGISLVIFGHIKMPNEVLQWIYAFHMPLFFVLSGYTYRAQKIDKDFLMKKIKTIYVPFLLFALIFCSGEMSSWAYIAYGSRNALLMSMALIGLLMLVDKWVNKKKLLLFIGQNSLTILCVHGTILLAASKVLPKVGLTGVDDMSLMIQGIVSYVIVIAASIPVILLIKRFVPNLVGK
ncbi:MAG: acyltransferase family protein [Muribaculaceae bacterium]|nr:acyltransferase family protein [Muribaculaceae bacterium]